MSVGTLRSCSVISRENSLVDSLQTQGLDPARRLAVQNLGNISSKLKHAFKIDCIKPDVLRSAGGHIARNSNVADVLGSEKLHEKMAINIIKKKLSLEAASSIVQPEWDARFVHNRGLSLPALKEGIELYTNDALASFERKRIKKNKRSGDSEKKSTRQIYLTKHSLLAPVKKPSSILMKPRQRVFGIEHEDDDSSLGSMSMMSQSTRHLPPISPPLELVEQVRGVWGDMVKNLREIAASLLYKDMNEIVTLIDPPPIVESLVGYVGILMGSSPNWIAMKRTIFKELIPVQKFIQDVSLALYYHIQHRICSNTIKFLLRVTIS